MRRDVIQSAPSIAFFEPNRSRLFVKKQIYKKEKESRLIAANLNSFSAHCTLPYRSFF